MSEVVCAKSQEEYEDDFEKDLDWLISEEGRSEDQVGQALLCKLRPHTQAHSSSTFYYHFVSLLYLIYLLQTGC